MKDRKLLMLLHTTKRCLRLFRLAMFVLLVAVMPDVIAESKGKLIDHLPFVRMMSDQGISIGSVEIIHQDQQGYMWFGGLDGLVRFDGYNWVTFRHDSTDA